MASTTYGQTGVDHVRPPILGAAGVRESATGARTVLNKALHRLSDQGNHTPCAGDPEGFYADHAPDVEAARAACRTCPVRVPCLAFAIANHERHGIWGGSDFTHHKTAADRTVLEPPDTAELLLAPQLATARP